MNSLPTILASAGVMAIACLAALTHSSADSPDSQPTRQSAALRANSPTAGEAASQTASIVSQPAPNREGLSSSVVSSGEFGIRVGPPHIPIEKFGGGDPVLCPGDSLFAQQPDAPAAFMAYTSEQSANLLRFENYSSVAGAITGVRWFGLDLQFTSGGFIECTEADPTFVIYFHHDSGGFPGAAACSYTLLAQRIPTGILYQGTELNEYRVTLPNSCVLVNGWISIVGMGDPNCWFLWLSSPDGDSRSICQGCQSTVQQDDLAVCVLGTPGGVFGACCNQSTGQCANNVEINQCAVTGLRFTPNVQCAQLQPPCQIATGACCLPNGGCAILTPADCLNSGGNWLGADTPCSQCPILGACCFGFTSCMALTQQDCVSEGGSWLGANSSCANCPKPPVCPKGSLFAQPPEGPAGFTAGTSELSSNFRRWENFTGVAGSIQSLTWWGLDLDSVGPNQWVECAEPDPTFQITFHQDANGVPGAVVCSYTVLATRTPLNISYLGAELNRYEATLPTPCVLVNGWVSIVGAGDPECWFLWMSSGIGDSWCTGCMPSPQDFDLSLCLQGEFGDVTGACCNDATGQCQNNVAINNCTGANQRFVTDSTCNDLQPRCGVVLGACCYPNATCTLLLQSECASSGGQWLGPNSICDSCPCVVPCPSGGVAEGEPVCSDGYIDAFNGGCIVDSPAFQPLSMGTTVCGRSGVFLVSGNVRGDFDWYEVIVGHPTTITWSARAEFRSRLLIYNGNFGCPATQLASAAATECFNYSVSASVQPGHYWLVIGPLAFDDNAGCGTKYTVRATMNPSCAGDIAPPERDFIVNVNDLLAVINSWGPCSGCATDIDGNGVVNVNDLLSVINSWGPCGGPS